MTDPDAMIADERFRPPARCRRDGVFVLLWVFGCLGVSSLGWAQPFEFRLPKEDGSIHLNENGKRVFVYQLDPKSKDGKYARANYLHPVHDPDGVVMTEDFPADHLHHRGIFWAWHQVLLDGKPVSDPWVCQNITWSKPTAFVSRHDAESATLEITREWHVPDPAKTDALLPVMRVGLTVKATPVQNDVRQLDFEIRLRALKKRLTLGGSDDVKGYGGFSPRIRLSEDVKFVGQIGPVQPKNIAVDGGAWMNVTRTLEGKKRSVTMLVHPSHPGFPVKWILRAKRSMQNPQWPGRTPVAISTQEDIVLRYRLLLHNNILDSAAIEAEWKRYARTIRD